MLYSMTAFARSENTTPEGIFCWELRSVNHRYLEPLLRLPEAFRHLEGEIRDRLRQTFSRGKIECTLTFTEAEAEGKLVVNNARAVQVVRALKSINALFKDQAPINPMQVLTWPGVLSGTFGNDSNRDREVSVLLSKALDELKACRLREGMELDLLLKEKLKDIGRETAALRELAPEMLQTQRQKVLGRFAELSISLDAQRLEQEMVLLAQKSDVTEELDRLDTHIKEVRRVLKGNDPCGRRLDFLMQELNREANTLASKAFDIRSTQAAVNLKVLIEQMREQIQNIE